MKVALVYNRESRSVINLFGTPNREIIGLQTIKRITDALKRGGHQVATFEGDKDLVNNLEHFMPRVVKGERPGLVFNVSYGIQGQARYTHVPSILEMVGIPYVASGPLAHSLALDKVVTKMILRQQGVPTPDFAVLNEPGDAVPDLAYPMIVKPKNEAVSFGLRIVNDEQELQDAAAVIHREFEQPVLVEQYIAGREINVGLLGNGPPEALPPVELIFGSGGPPIYTLEDKRQTSGRKVHHACPAPVSDAIRDKAKAIAVRAFEALGCADCARVDMRLDDQDNLYVLEINSLPSLGEHGSYCYGAEHAGLDFAALVNRLVEVASARYFGTPAPPQIDTRTTDVSGRAFAYITQRRDEMETRLKEWTELASHAGDPIGIQEAVGRCDRLLTGIGLRPVQAPTEKSVVWAWETPTGFTDGTLLVAHIDVPHDGHMRLPSFRREREWLCGDGIGTSRAPLVTLEYMLRALRSVKRLKNTPLGVLLYGDEGHDGQLSATMIRSAAGQAKRVLVLRPGNPDQSVITQRRGQRKYRFRVVGEPRHPGKASKKPEVLRWAWTQLDGFSELTSRKARVSVSAVDVRTEALPLLLPHRVTVTLLVTYPEPAVADEIEERIRGIIPKGGPRWELQRLSDRPPLKERRGTLRLYRQLERAAQKWDMPFRRDTSVWSSVAGLVPASTACVCGVGPVARDLGTPHEAVQRISLVQRTLLLTEFLLGEPGKS